MSRMTNTTGSQELSCAGVLANMTDYAYTIDRLLKAGFEMRVYRDDDQGMYFVSFLKENTTVGSAPNHGKAQYGKAGRQIET